MTNITETPPKVIVALMIGELRWQPRLNRISSEVVERAVELWRQHPSALVVCESAPMASLAAERGVPPGVLMTGLPESSGHTTRRLAQSLRNYRRELPGGPWWIVTHQLHARRAARVFARCGLPVESRTVDTPFDPADSDWKLKSTGVFRAYNLVAWLYCYLRGWV